ncbi:MULTISPECIES: efflux transporter outer membrane subunit [Hydrocarboniphaga]|jgi:multidrug efflux system outer membrane protein|uniref:efflux transporter outer membrane subunit n=1 Tax=Hydrocarboniphaga TaxID=243627 RepID=UPI002ABC4526|nr:efflux transporter outer membrane subunit [Hydrocarboniphaga sp.]MDZ4077868.1 efflux transporter outer membrane subunit [Hydrocarboniphaga sp.]
MKRLVITLLCAVLGACAASPGQHETITAPASEPPMLDAWRELLGDENLFALVRRSLQAGPDLRIAAANLRKSRALLRESLGTRYPSTEVQVGSTIDETSNDPSSDRPDVFSGGLALAYDFDVAGRRRNSIDAARADAAAERAAYENIQLQVAAETIRAYTDACSLDQQIELSLRIQASQKRTLELVEKRVAAGQDAALEASLARGQLEQLSAALPSLQADRAAALLRLAALSGSSPAQAGHEAFACSALPQLDVRLPAGTDLDGAMLIASRPDLREGELRVRAALARIGVANAEFYPRVTLGARVGAGGETMRSVGFQWSLSPLISWTFPNRIAAESRLQQAEAEHEAVFAQWDRAVLLALRDIETALVRRTREQERWATLARARDAYGEASRRAETRYRVGSDNILGVLEAQRRLSQTEAELAVSAARIVESQLALFVALGGVRCCRSTWVNHPRCIVRSDH